MKNKLLKNILITLSFVSLLLSCSMNVEEKKTGNISFYLPENLSISRSNTTELSLYPEEYKVTLFYLEENRYVIDKVYKGGDIVIKALPIGKFNMTIEGRTPGHVFTGQTTFDLQEETMNVPIDIISSRLFGSIKIDIDDKSSIPFDKYFYSLEKSDGEVILDNKEITVENKKGSVTIPELYSGVNYKVTLYGEDSSFIYKSEEKEFINPIDNPTLTFNNFTPYSGNIIVLYKDAISDNMKLTLTNKESGKQIIKEVTSLPYSFRKITPGTYTLLIESDNNEVTYSFNEDIKVVSGENSECLIKGNTKNVIYVSENGSDSNYGVKNSPYKTINKALECTKKDLNICISGTLAEDVVIDKDANILIFGDKKNPTNSVTGAISIINDKSIVTIENIETSSINYNKGKLSLNDGFKGNKINIAPLMCLYINGKLKNTSGEKITLNLSQYNENIKIINTSLDNEISKFNISDANFLIDKYGTVQYKTQPITITVAEASKYTPDSFKYKILEENGTLLEENTFTSSGITSTVELKHSIPYTVIVTCSDSNYDYEEVLSVTGDQGNAIFSNLKAINGSLEIISGASSITLPMNITVSDGITNRSYEIISFPYLIEKLKPGFYQIEGTSSNPDEVLETVFGKVDVGTKGQVSFKTSSNIIP